MATEKKRIAGELVAWQLVHLPLVVWSEHPPDLDRLNPYRTSERAAPVKSEAQQQREHTVGFARLKEAWVGDGETVVMDTNGQVVG